MEPNFWNFHAINFNFPFCSFQDPKEAERHGGLPCSSSANNSNLQQIAGSTTKHIVKEENNTQQKTPRQPSKTPLTGLTEDLNQERMSHPSLETLGAL